MTVLHDYEAASVQGILLVGSDERLRPGDAETLCADVDEDGRVGLTSLQITLVGDRSDPVVATVNRTAGEIDQSGRYDVRTRFNPDSGLADATGSIQITMWIDGSSPGPRR